MLRYVAIAERAQVANKFVQHQVNAWTTIDTAEFVARNDFEKQVGQIHEFLRVGEGLIASLVERIRIEERPDLSAAARPMK